MKGTTVKQSLVFFVALGLMGIFSTSVSFSALGDEGKDLAVLARTAFDAGEFQTARDHYQSLVDSGIENGHLYYNLALAEYRLGNTGRAMAGFLAARSLLPRHPDVRANIKSLMDDLTDQVDAKESPALVESIFFWIPRFTVRELTTATGASMGVLGVLLWLCLLVPRLSVAKRFVYALLIVPVLLGASVVIKADLARVWGAVISEEARAYSGPGTGNTLVFKVREGAPVQVLDATEDWYKVQITGDKKGWISRKEMAVHLF